jgi:hypothetical protein
MGSKYLRKAATTAGAIFSLCATFAHAAILEISPTNQTIVQGDVAHFAAVLVDNAGDTLPVKFTWNGPAGYYSTNQIISVTNAGKYSLSTYDAGGYISSSECAVLNVKIPPTVSISTNTLVLTCSRPQLSLSAKTTAQNPAYVWTGPGLVSGADSAHPLVNLPGTYSVTITSSNGCTASASVSVSEDKALPPLSVETPDILTCTKTSVVLRASSTSNVFYHWAGPGIIAGTNSGTCVVNQPGLYTVTVTSYGSFGLIAVGTINLNTNLLIGIPFATNYYNPPNGTNLYGELIPGYIHPSYPPLPYPSIDPYVDSCPEVPLGAVIDQNGVTNLVTSNPYQLPVHIISGINFTNWVYPIVYDEDLHYSFPFVGNGCSATAMVLVQRESDPSTNSAPQDLNREFVSFGQPFWGNPNTKVNGVLVRDLRKTLLLDPTNQTSSPLILGMPGRSLSITTNAVYWLNRRLQAVGTPVSLPDFGDQILSSTNGQTAPPLPLTKDGRFQNRLLGEAIALGLNLRMDVELAQFALSSSFCTQKALAGKDKLIGTDDDRLNRIGSDNLLNSGDETQQFTISPVIFDALCSSHLPYTVEGVYGLANRALAAQPTGNASLTDVSEAVQTVLRAFKAGRFCVQCE